MRTGRRCTTLMKFPVAFCGGSSASVEPVPMVKPLMRPSKARRRPYMSTSSSHALTDAQIGQLRFLEIGVDPDFGERADGHQALPGLHVVARVHVAPRDHAADLGKDVAVAQIQFGLVEIGLGLFQLGLGLLDGRCVLHQTWRRCGPNCPRDRACKTPR